MKKYIILILVLLFVFSTKAVCLPAKRALIIAISNYPIDSKWQQIHASNDYFILKELLESKRFQIDVLQNQHATKYQITKKLKDLKSNSEHGDTVLIHFSCHGQLMEDYNGDEPDKLDESIIPYDAKMYYEKGKYNGENHLRDDELNNYLYAIRKKIGPKGILLVTIDACHSASATRGESDEFIRGTDVIFTKRVNFSYPDINTIRRKDPPLLKKRYLAPLIVISACKSNQNNYEIKKYGRYYGALTWYFCQVLSNETLSDFPKWTKQLKNVISRSVRKQTLVIETTLPINYGQE